MSTTTVPTGVTSRDQTHTLFAQTMQYVAVTTALFAVGAYLGRNLHGAVGIIAFVGAVGPDRLRHRDDLREDPERGPDLLVLGLVIFAGLIMFDFQRLRRSTDIDSAPLLAASIFLDILNVFLFFLQIFSRPTES